MAIFVVQPDLTRLPLSRGILAQQLATVGVPIDIAHGVAEKVQSKLVKEKIREITFADLQGVISSVLSDQVSDETAHRFDKWGEFQTKNMPVIILLTGGNGTGKSTLASQLCSRLGINRLTSTDIIREVMRELSVESLVPQLYQSSYKVTPPPGARKEDPIAGFIHQVNAVNIGVQAIINRACKEHTSMILEGIHLMPSMADSVIHKGVVTVPITLIVPDPRDHSQRFLTRDIETNGDRPSHEYSSNFKSIRAIHDYLVTEAIALNHMVLDTAEIETSIPAIVDLILAKADAMETQMALENK